MARVPAIELAPGVVRTRPLCTDFRLNEQTAHVLGELEYERVAFTHGTEITDGARDAVRGFLAEVAGA